jgi:regulator of protease activity HflC (stomatin/prohibitin superfamily)
MAAYPESLGDLPAAPVKRGGWRFIGRHLPSLSVGVLLAFLAATVLFPYVVITVPSGMVGVLWKRFNGYDLYCLCFVGRGTILDPRELRDEGLHIIWPWDKIYLYNLRLQSTAQTYNAISKDGVNVSVQVSIRYQLVHNYVAVLHKFIGPDYFASVINPEIGSHTRETISQYTAQEVYTSRDAIEQKVQSSAQKSLVSHLNILVQPDAMEQPDPRNYKDSLQNSILILDTPVLGIELPLEIVAAINRQTQQFYEIQEFKYRVEREAQESRRKQIEANGIAAFQQTVSKGISDSYLRWRGIEATLALAQSQNSKIVVIGGGKDGLPIILGNVDSAPAAGGAPTVNAPGGLLSVPPAAAPNSAPSTGTNKPLSSGASPPTPVINNPPTGPTQKQTTGSSSSAPATDAQPKSSIPHDLADLEGLLSRIYDALRAPNSAPNSGTGPQSKESAAGAADRPGK